MKVITDFTHQLNWINPFNPFKLTQLLLFFLIYRSNRKNVYEKSNVAQMMSQSNTNATPMQQKFHIIILFILGVAVKSTLDNTSTVQYAGLMGQLADKARSVVRDLGKSYL